MDSQKLFFLVLFIIIALSLSIYFYIESEVRYCQSFCSGNILETIECMSDCEVYENLFLSHKVEAAKIKATQLRIGNLKSAVQTYYTTVGQYPTQSEGLQVLLFPPDNLLPFLEKEYKDEWGNAFMYFNPPKRGSGPFEIVSKGPDRREGTDDDISR